MYATGSEMEAHRCSGTIGTWAMVSAKGTSGDLSVIVTSLPDAETPVIALQMPVLSRAGYFLSRLNVKTTSAGEKGLPSLHFTPCRIV